MVIFGATMINVSAIASPLSIKCVYPFYTGSSRSLTSSIAFLPTAELDSVEFNSCALKPWAPSPRALSVCSLK